MPHVIYEVYIKKNLILWSGLVYYTTSCHYRTEMKDDLQGTWEERAEGGGCIARV